MSLKKTTLAIMSFVIVCAIILVFPVLGSFAEQGTLTVGMSRTPATLYPGATTALPDIALNFLIYDGLVTTVSGEIKPLLAESWETSPDGLSTDRENVMGKRPVLDRENVTPPSPQK